MPAWFSWFLSAWGLLLLAAFDSSPIFYLPFANDFVIVYLTARNPGHFWLYPVMAAAGSVIGTAVTHVTGTWIGEEGLERWMSSRRLESLRRRMKTTGAIALGVPSVFPPPFPFTPFALAAGAFKVNRGLFLATVGVLRLLRFLAEALLARRYGKALVGWMESPTFKTVIWGFVVLVIAGTVYSIYRVAFRRASPAASRA